MVSEVSICNQALLFVGAETITSLDDPQQEARLCKNLYADARDYVLADRQWTFITNRATLAKSSSAPEFGFGSRFQIPNDCIRVYKAWDYNSGHKNPELSPNKMYWQLEGNYILADADIIQIKYGKKITDTSKYSPGFVKALAYYLASTLAIPVQNSRQLQNDMFALYDKHLDDAAAVDGMQGRSRVIRSSKLTSVRGGYGPLVED